MSLRRCVSVCLCVYTNAAQCLFVFLCLCAMKCICDSVYLCLSLSLNLAVSMSPSVSFCVDVSHAAVCSVPLCLRVVVSVCRFACVSACVELSACVRIPRSYPRCRFEDSSTVPRAVSVACAACATYATFANIQLDTYIHINAHARPYYATSNASARHPRPHLTRSIKIGAQRPTFVPLLKRFNCKLVGQDPLSRTTAANARFAAKIPRHPTHSFEPRLLNPALARTQMAPAKRLCARGFFQAERLLPGAARYARSQDVGLGSSLDEDGRVAKVPDTWVLRDDGADRVVDFETSLQSGNEESSCDWSDDVGVRLEDLLRVAHVLHLGPLVLRLGGPSSDLLSAQLQTAPSWMAGV